MLAIRAATYGEVITFTTACPACKALNEAHRNLPHLLSTMVEVEENNPVRLSDEIVVYIRPYNLTNITKVGLASFEETRKLQALELNENLDYSAQINESMHRIADLTMNAMADCVIKVVVPEGEVTDASEIL